MSGGRHVGLLRGINVGGKHKLPMRDLVAIVEAAGAEDARTYIQSGNVLFRATPSVAKRLPGRVEAAIVDRFGFAAPLLVRTSSEWQRLIARNPFAKRGVDPAGLFVALLADRPTKARVARLEPDRSPPDTFVVSGREIYLHCPNGVARTKLTTDWFDRRLETVSTVRNWKTTLKLAALMEP